MSRIGAGEWSDLHPFNASGLLGGNWFSCDARNSLNTRGRVNMCTVVIDVPVTSIVYTWFQGHYRCATGSWLYGQIRIDEDVRGLRHALSPMLPHLVVNLYLS